MKLRKRIFAAFTLIQLMIAGAVCFRYQNQAISLFLNGVSESANRQPALFVLLVAFGGIALCFCLSLFNRSRWMQEDSVIRFGGAYIQTRTLALTQAVQRLDVFLTVLLSCVELIVSCQLAMIYFQQPLHPLFAYCMIAVIVGVLIWALLGMWRLQRR